MSTANTSSNPLDSVVLQKEKEWREAFHLRVKALEETVVQKDKELKQEKLRFRKLKEDFEYNLKLIIERDAELEKYDAVIGKVKEEEHIKTAEVSELCVKIDELKIKLDNEQKAKDELQRHYQKVFPLCAKPPPSLNSPQYFIMRPISNHSSSPQKSPSLLTLTTLS